MCHVSGHCDKRFTAYRVGRVGPGGVTVEWLAGRGGGMSGAGRWEECGRKVRGRWEEGGRKVGGR